MLLITQLQMTDMYGKELLTPWLDQLCMVFVKMTAPLSEWNIIRAELNDVQFFSENSLIFQ